MNVHRITFALAAIVLIQLSILIVTVIEDREQQLKASNKNAETLAQLAVTETDHFFFQYLSILKTLSSTDFIDRQEAAEATRVFQRLNEQYPEIVNFAAVRVDGSFFASGQPFPGGTAPNISSLEFFTKLRDGEQVIVMKPHTGPISGETVTGLAIPLWDTAGRFNGLIGVSINFQSLVQRWQVVMENSGNSFVVHNNQDRIFHVPGNLKDFADNYYQSAAHRDQSLELGGVRFTQYTRKAPFSGWYFSILLPDKTTLKELLSFPKEVYILGAFLILTLFVLSAMIFQTRQWALQLSIEKEKLEESELRFRQLAENISSVFWISPPDKNEIIYVSPAFEQVWGISRKQLYDKPLIWLEAIDEKDRPRVLKAAQDQQSTGEYDLTYKIRRPDGKEVHIHDRAFPLKNEQGEVYRIVGIAEDISAQVAQQAELARQQAQLQAIVQSSVDAIGVSLEGIHVLVNPAYVQMFGYRDEQQLLGAPIFPLIAESERARIRQFVADRMSGITANTHYVTRGRRKNGQEFDMEVTVATYGTQPEIYTLVILRDITERLRLEVQLRQSQKLEAVGTLAGGIAHDFNNILSAIIGFSEIAWDSLPANAPQREDLRQVLEAALRAKDLVSQILTFSRQAETSPTHLDPAMVCREALKILRPSIPSTIDIVAEIAEVNCTVLIDRIQLHQVIMNLCTNAYHAMETTGGRLYLRLHQQTRDDWQEEAGARATGIVLTVADTGTGIAAEVLPRIFDPYYTTKEIGKGTGMGLAIVHGIVRNCHGEITCESEPGKGTTFQVWLPASEIPAKIAPEEPETMVRGSEHILLVDDEAALTDLGRIVLEKEGYQVSTCANGKQALELFSSMPEAIDLVITDQTMPDLTGDELAKRLLAIRSDLPVIVSTGYSSIISEETAEQIGIREIIQKPLTKKDYHRLLRQYLRMG